MKPKKNIFYGNFYFKIKDKEVHVPFLEALFIVMFIICVGYSDWRCGPINHDADDMPKKIMKK
jgi:hypothetical protein